MRRTVLPLTLSLPLVLAGCFETDMDTDLSGSDTDDPVGESGDATSAGTSGGEATSTGVEPDSGADESTGPGDDTGTVPDDADGDGSPDDDDCAPQDPQVHPGAQEACNGQDDDCDGEIDESWSELGTSCDGDDPDECEDGVYVCSPGGAGVICGDGPRTEAAEEVCNGADDDCNGVADDPWATELGTPCDGNDADQCETGVYVCAGDGLGLECSGDMNEIEICNGNDDDCDGQIDEGCDDDGDDHCDAGMTVVGNPAVCNPALGEDCDDTDPLVNPSADEICNGFDDDCDLQIDAADADTPWPALDGYESNDIYFVSPELFEAADHATPFGPSPTSFHAVDNPDFFTWDDVVDPFVPTFMMCHMSGMAGGMLVDVELGYRRRGDPTFPYVYDDHQCTNLGNGDTCSLVVSPTGGFGPGNEHQFYVGVVPVGGIDQCNASYVLECRRDYINIW